MSLWHIHYTAAAERDLHNIYSYIAYQLLEAQTAARQAKRIMDAIDRLDTLPLRHPLYEDEPWHSQGVRFFPVDNYLVFYRPEPALHAVHIIRIMYGGQDIRQQMRNSE